MRLLAIVLISLHASAAAAEESTAAAEAAAAASPLAQPVASSPAPATPAAADAAAASEPTEPAPTSTAPAQVPGAAVHAPLAAPAPVLGPSEAVPPRERWYALSPGTHFGLGLDAGAPDGAGATALFRPWWWLRVNGGLAYDVIGYGVRGGVTFLPANWVATPTLSLDLGHFFSGDATRFATNSSDATKALLKHATYDFASAQVGFEFGSQRRFLFFVRGGVAYVSAKAAGNELTALAREKSSDKSIDFTLGDATVHGVIPCFSLGFLVFVI